MTPLPEFVRVMIPDDQGSLLVLAERRQPVLWNFPGGRVEVGESPEDAARREVLEEVGLVVSRLVLVQSREYEIGPKRWLGHFFHAHGKAGTASIREHDRCSELRYVRPADLELLPSVKGVLVEPARMLSSRR